MVAHRVPLTRPQQPHQHPLRQRLCLKCPQHQSEMGQQMKAMTLIRTALLCLCSFALTTALAQVQQSYQLLTTQGWNLLGNSVDKSINVATTFGDTSKVTSVWKWDNAGNKWLFYAPSLSAAELQTYAASNGFGVLTSIEGGEGYWVNAKTATDYGTHTGLGVTTPKLGVGWNLIASGGTADSKDVSVEMFSHISKKFVDVASVWQWAGTKWNMYAPSLYMDGTLASYLTSNNMGSVLGSISGNGKGFWVKGDAAKVVTPKVVYATSYANKNRLDITDTEMPRSDQINGWKWPGIGDDTSAGFGNRPFAIADFTQEGKYSVAAFQSKFSSNAMLTIGHADMPAKMYITQRNAAGVYMDITTKLIKTEADRYTCETPSYAIVADFNNDDKPDIFVACTGPDFQVVPGINQRGDVPQFAYISQPDGTYKQWKSTRTAYAHQCSAGDITGDGNVDVVCVDPFAGYTQPFTFVGDGKGGFTTDDTRFLRVKGSIYGIELISTTGNGKLDVLLGGVTPNADDWADGWYNNVIIKNNGSGYFTINTPIVLPTSTSPMLINGKHYSYSGAMDVVVNNGFIYILQGTAFVGSTAIRKISLSNVSDQSLIFENLGTFSGWQKNVTLIKPTSDGYLVPIMLCQYAKTDPLFATSACGFKVKM